MMKDHRIILSMAVVLFVSIVAIVFTSNSNQEVELTEDQKLFKELSAKSFGEFGSDKYLIKDGYISKIYPNTKVKDLIKELHEDAVIYDGKNKVADGVVKTGMTLKLYDLTFTLLVTGDLNNDGILNQIDVNRLIRNIGKEDITNVEIILSDLNGDGLVNELDADFGADYLLGKSELKFTESSVLDANVNLNGSALSDGWYNTEVSLVIPYFGYGYEYEVFGTKEISKTKGAATTTLTFNKNGAYLVNVYYHANDGNTKIYNYVFGIDYSRNRCNELGAETLSECMLVNDDANYASVEEAKNGIKKKTTDLTQISTTDEGLLSIKDKDGDAFYYRGDVKDNFVEFAGYAWRIVRRNGDGSVRLVYNGTSTNSTGANTQVGNSYFGVPGINFKYMGYKYSEDLSFVEVNTPIKVSLNLGSYSFADSYSCDDSTHNCTLSGNQISRSDSSYYNKIFNGDVSNGYKPYKYFKLSSNISAVFEAVEQIDGSTTYVLAKYYGYLEQNSPRSSAANIKSEIDNWYVNNLLSKSDVDGHKWSEYLVDNYYCDDKTWSSTFGSEAMLYFKSYDRTSGSGRPSLICPNENDEYTVANGELEYPIGLLTADEVALAGGRSGISNSNYWLYTAQYYWTMSPGSIWSSSPLDVFGVSNTGSLSRIVSLSSSSGPYGVRPVINLSKDVLFISGTGTANDPYKVALSK